MLVVLRGPSGSGKSTIARLLQDRLGVPSAILQQDHFRRVIYREKLDGGMEHAALLANAAQFALDRGHYVILDGIFPSARYAQTIESIAQVSDVARFYSFDLTFDDTLRRHATRPQAADFGEQDMREWYVGWDPLPFVNEARIGVEASPDAIVERILTSR